MVTLSEGLQMTTHASAQSLHELVQNNKLPTITATQLVNKWQAETLARRRNLKSYFNDHFATLIASPSYAAQAGESVAPVIYRGTAVTAKSGEHAFFFVEKSTEYRKQPLGDNAVASRTGTVVPLWHTMIPDALAREKAASDLVDAGLTPHFCLVYKTVVKRLPGDYITFTRYTEFAGPKTVAECLEDETYRKSLAFELHAKLQVTTAFAVALKHVDTAFFQGDLHTGNVVVQPLAADGPSGVAIENPFCATYKSRFLFRIIDFISAFAPLDYGAYYDDAPEFFASVFHALFHKQRYALADILAFFYQFDVTAGRPFSMLTSLAFTYVHQNSTRKEVDVAKGLAQMLLSFYDDPPGPGTLYGARRRRRGSTRRSGRKTSRRRGSTRGGRK
jgi:hypothetical protein